MKCLSLSILIFLLSALSQAQSSNKYTTATNQISGEVQLLSQYVERGLSMSDNNPAMNASFLYNLGSQVKMGFWGSNISNLSAVDDNFWFKLLAQFDVTFGSNLNSHIYFSDDHFYKSNQRNGQRFGANFEYYTYMFGFEWMSNFEGTRSNAEYFDFGKYFYFSGNKMRYGGIVGYTLNTVRGVSSYFDFKAVGQYLMNPTTTIEVGLTLNMNNTYFGKRGDPELYGGIKLTY
ncbi:MAG: TorF family putative porin [Pseudobdellovibrio sp.]